MMHPLEEEIQAIVEACNQGQISADERNYLLTEIRDIKAANECANNEQMFRYLVQVCNAGMGLV